MFRFLALAIGTLMQCACSVGFNNWKRPILYTGQTDVRYVAARPQLKSMAREDGPRAGKAVGVVLVDIR